MPNQWPCSLCRTCPTGGMCIHMHCAWFLAAGWCCQACLAKTRAGDNCAVLSNVLCCAVLQDRERGVVWEETIIFLHDDAKMVGTLRWHVASLVPAATQ